MAVPRKSLDSDQQLDLFSIAKPTYDTTDSIRPNGREALARVSSENGPRTGGQGSPSPDPPGRGGENEGRNGHSPNRLDEAGVNGRPGTPPGLGDGAGEVHPAPVRDLAVGHHRREEP